jgi:hypothetical protein
MQQARDSDRAVALTDSAMSCQGPRVMKVLLKRAKREFTALLDRFEDVMRQDHLGR